MSIEVWSCGGSAHHAPQKAVAAPGVPSKVTGRQTPDPSRVPDDKSPGVLISQGSGAIWR